jgi:hypothetical protein
MENTFIRIASLYIIVALAALAQPVPPDHDVIFERRIAGPEGGPHAGAVTFAASAFGIPGETVKNAPYSAEAVSETTQSLTDGNRISRKTTTAMYRDSEGRTRRETTFPGIGPWASSGEPAQLVFIHDPVAGVGYVLDVKEKTARKTPSGANAVFTFRRGEAITPPLPPIPGPGIRVERQIAIAGKMADRIEASKAQTKSESLGKQVMEGLTVEGTRNTLTIPAGQIGNERPIDIVTERWHSPDLKTVIMTRHVDPRMGETLYKLTNVRRGPQPQQLFEVPPDYTIKKEEPMLMERKLKEK